MREASEDIDEMLQMEFGPPFALQDEQIGGVNQRYFAGLIKNNHQLLFVPEENGLYLYNPTTL